MSHQLKSIMSLTRPLSYILHRAPPSIALRGNVTSSIIANNNFAPSPTAHTRRCKHSSTQVKRLFKNRFKNDRVSRRREKDAAAELSSQGGGEVLTSTPPPTPNTHLTKVPLDPVYKPVFKSTFLKNGWSAPPPPEVKVPDYPFRVKRTGRKPFGAVGFLPVYSDFRIHGTKRTTIIRNVTGDIPVFLRELRAFLQLPIGKKLLRSSDKTPRGGGEGGRGVNAENPIRIRTGGAIEVNGERMREVKLWLAGLGF